jgi:hypothetical protein
MKFNNVEEMVAFVATAPKVPEWQKRLFSKYSKEVKVHSKGELFFKIDRLFPNEAPEAKAHRVLSFESVTKGSFWKGVNNVQQIFQNSSFTFEASEKTVKFLSDKKFGEYNFFTFFLQKWCEVALSTDPNALIVVYPFEFMKGVSFPQIMFIPSEHIRYRDNETILFVSEEESVVEYDLTPDVIVDRAVVLDQGINKLNVIETKQQDYTPVTLKAIIKRPVYHMFTLDGFYRFEQDETEATTFHYKFWLHNKNFLPCMSAGGRSAENGIFESFFNVFCPFGNLALLQHSQHTAVNFIFSFPRMSEIETPCDAYGCEGGAILLETPTEDYPDGKKPCVRCGGTGFTAKQSPYKIYKKRLEPNSMNEEVARTVLNTPEVQFYTPDVAILDYSKAEWRDYLESAEAAVYVFQKVKTGNVESEGSKEMDFKDRYNFLSAIAKSFYAATRFTKQCFENYLNANPVEVTIQVPQSLAIVSEVEGFEVLDTLLKSDAPILLKANQIETFVGKYVSSNSFIRKAYNILKRIDLLFFYNDLQIQAQKAANVVTAEQWAMHVFSFPVLANMWYSDNTIFDLPEDQIETKLLEELKPLMPKTSDLKQSVLDTVKQGNVK